MTTLVTSEHYSQVHVTSCIKKKKNTHTHARTHTHTQKPITVFHTFMMPIFNPTTRNHMKFCVSSARIYDYFPLWFNLLAAGTKIYTQLCNMFLCITRISATLNLCAVTSESDRTANNHDLVMTYTIRFHTESVRMFNIYLHTKLQTSLTQPLWVWCNHHVLF
jgi:hypothetical protein